MSKTTMRIFGLRPIPRCLIKRETMEAHLGRPFHMQELETVLSSFAGQIETSAHYMRFYLTKNL